MTKPTADISKSNLAKLCGVSKGTVSYWCNKLYITELTELGYRKTQKVFTPAQWHFLYRRLDF